MCSIVLFGLLQIKEYRIQGEKYVLLNATNIGIFFLIYILTTIVFYFLFDNEIEKGFLNKEHLDVVDNLDPKTLKKITDNMYTGFDPMYGKED